MSKKIKKRKVDIWNIENLFYLQSGLSRIFKIICHYEIFKITEKVKGDSLECGVFKGNSLVRFMTFRDLLKIKNKKIFIFNFFGNFKIKQID